MRTDVVAVVSCLYFAFEGEGAGLLQYPPFTVTKTHVVSRARLPGYIRLPGYKLSGYNLLRKSGTRREKRGEYN